MEFYRQACKNCGGDLQPLNESIYKCRYCGCTYDRDAVEKHVESIRKLFDDIKLDAISNARKNLYNAVNAEFISSQHVHECCVILKQFLPDDFQANFYELAIGSNSKKLAKFIRRINTSEHMDCIETMIKFLINSLQSEYILDTGDLIERAYKNTDLIKFEQYSTQLAEEAEKIENCIYLTTYPRDVFVGYSSKDMPLVLELVACLEEQGLSCFVSARNLRHGKGAVENYDKALKEAMDNCQTFVFVSTTNSRHPGCDALRKEIPYIRTTDIAAAPAEFKNDYTKIPHQFKKHRVEYRIEESRRMAAADRITNEFFDGYERVYSPEEVAERVLNHANEEQSEVEEAALGSQRHFVHPTKFCVNCRRECLDNAQFCSVCGGSRFAGSLSEVDLIHKIEELNKQLGNKVREEEKEKADQEDRERARAAAEERENARRAAEQKAKEDAKDQARRDADVVAKLVADRARRVVRSTTVQKPQSEDPDALTYTDTLLSGNDEKSLRDAETIAKLVAEERAKREAADKAKRIAADRARREEALKAKREAEKKLMSDAAAKSRMAVEQKSRYNVVQKTPGAHNSVRDEKYVSFASRNTVASGMLIKCKEDVYEIEVPYGVSVIGKNAFVESAHLTKVIIPSSVTRIDREAFWNLKFLKTVHLSDGLNAINEEAFWGCQMLEQITLPPSLTHIGARAFKFCSSITSIGLTDGMRALAEGAFHGCINLRNVYIPDSIETVGKYAFCDCKALEKILIPSSVVEIGDYAFNGCENLTSVTIPRSVQYLGRGAFANCHNLKSVTLPRSLSVFDGTFPRSVTIHYI